MKRSLLILSTVFTMLSAPVFAQTNYGSGSTGSSVVQAVNSQASHAAFTNMMVKG